jgi:hypothetical protein
MRTVRASVALTVVVLATLFFSNYFHPYWIRAFMEGRTFEPAWGWFSLGWLSLTWGYDFLATLIASLVLAPLLPRSAAIWWYVGLGALIAGVRLLSSHNFFSANADGTERVAALTWIYGSYVMSILGAAAGGTLVLTLGRLALPSNNRWRGP